MFPNTFSRSTNTQARVVDEANSSKSTSFVNLICKFCLQFVSNKYIICTLMGHTVLKYSMYLVHTGMHKC